LFRRSTRDGRRVIDMEESGDCYHYHGMGVHFTGTFVRAREALFDGGVVDEIGLQSLHSIAGDYYDDLSRCFQSLGETHNLDTFSAIATIGGVRGLYTIMEAIMLRSASGELWAAFIDGDVVRYFTTNPNFARELPVTIEKWRERFHSKPVIMQQPKRGADAA